MSPNKRESLSNKFSIVELKKILEKHKPRSSIKGVKNKMYKSGKGELYERIWINGEKIRLSHIIFRIENNKEIPKGFNIHHKDENKRNNSPNNLELIEARSHALFNLNNNKGVNNG